MQHHRNPPQKSFFAYLLPFIILLLLGLIVFFLISFWGKLANKFNTTNSYATLEVLQGQAKVKLWGEGNNWENVPGQIIQLYTGDAVQSLDGSKAKITFFKKNSLILNSNSSLILNEVNQDKQTFQTDLELLNGEAWFNVERDINPNSKFQVKTGHLQLETSYATFDLGPDILRVIKGTVEAQIQNNGKTLKTVNIGVGQELILTADKLQQLTANPESDLELLGMVADAFKLSGWYLFNTQQIGLNSATGTGFDFTAQPTTSGATSTDLTETANTNTSATTDFQLTKPVITSPGKNGAEVKIDKSTQIIEGTVAKGTAKVVVNNYTLQAFKKGDTTWRYTASVNYGSLAKGKNVYQIYAVDAEGTQSLPATLTLIYGETTENAATTKPNSAEKETMTTSTTSADETATGELKITAPNNGENYTTAETHLVISGTAPSNAAKISVSGYTLQSYQKGSGAWRYVADPQYQNLTAGEANTYKVTAYDENDKVIASTQITITVEKAKTVSEENPTSDSGAVAE